MISSALFNVVTQFGYKLTLQIFLHGLILYQAKKHAQKGFWEIAPSQYFKNKSVVKPVSVIEVSM